jgi:putative glutamine amidotransferase
VSWVQAGDPGAHGCLRAVEDAGGEPLPLRAEADSWTATLPALDGLILRGGNAIDPRRYGEENRGRCRLVIPHRDDLEQEALEYCLDRGLPVLGICRGMQFINVALGGSMQQDLTITTIEHESEGDRSRFHPVSVTPGTKLAAIAGCEGSLHVNSRHHQGVVPAQMAPGLRLSAIAPDGVVEGIETTDDRFLLGIQFHPEIPGEVPPLVPIFEVLVSRARDR